MLMNSNELLLSINKRLQESGIIKDITDFYHEHSEYFTECSNVTECSNDNRYIISSCDISIAMCCKPEERQDTDVFITMDIGGHDVTRDCLHDYSNAIGTGILLKHIINNEEVSRHVCN